MPTSAEKNQFKRLIGNYNAQTPIADSEVNSYLDDATQEVTADFTSTTLAGISDPVEDFDNLAPQFKPEVIVFAAINWWWNKAAKHAERHNQGVGDATQNAGEKFDRAMAMIEKLEARYATIQTLGTDITFGNASRFSKLTLTRIGGRSEEAVLEDG